MLRRQRLKSDIYSIHSPIFSFNRLSNPILVMATHGRTKTRISKRKHTKTKVYVFWKSHTVVIKRINITLPHSLYFRFNPCLSFSYLPHAPPPPPPPAPLPPPPPPPSPRPPSPTFPFIVFCLTFLSYFYHFPCRTFCRPSFPFCFFFLLYSFSPLKLLFFSRFFGNWAEHRNHFQYLIICD